jgi:murein DD-endopeptidase MepM/ murein hydrolase activator NlpD
VGDRSGSELARLAREVAADAGKIRLRAGTKKAALVGRRSVAALALALAVLVAFPPFAWPVRGRVSSEFFFRHAPGSPRFLALEFHGGLDIAAAAGTLVRAAAPGVVVEAGYSPELGNHVTMRHLFGFTSVYGHLSRLDVAAGRLILFRGLPTLGAVGSTGRSTGPHLHFALRAGRLLLPPSALLAFHSLRRTLLGF